MRGRGAKRPEMRPSRSCGGGGGKTNQTIAKPNRRLQCRCIAPLEAGYAHMSSIDPHERSDLAHDSIQRQCHPVYKAPPTLPTPSGIAEQCRLHAHALSTDVCGLVRVEQLRRSRNPHKCPRLLRLRTHPQGLLEWGHSAAVVSCWPRPCGLGLMSDFVHRPALPGNLGGHEAVALAPGGFAPRC